MVLHLHRLALQLKSSTKVPDTIKSKVHVSMAVLLAVPQYVDWLADQDNEDEDEHGWLLVTSNGGWRTVMVKWIGEAWRATENNEDTDLALLPIDPGHSQTLSAHWHAMLKQLFGGLPKSKCSIPPTEFNAEAMWMKALAEMAEDEIPDDGAIEVDSDEVYEE